MKIAEIVIPPFVKDVKKVRIFKERNKNNSVYLIGRLIILGQLVQEITHNL